MLTDAELRAIEKIEASLRPDDDKGLTASEWADLRGVSERTMRARIRRGLETGTMERGKRMVMLISGVERPAPVYRIVEDA